MIKNETRLSSLMGSWTLSSHLKIASYDIQSAFVIHITTDPMRHYGCSIDDCLEANNQICQKSQECHDMADTVSEWSDVSVFYFQEFKIDGSFPYPYNGSLQTGIWVGPYNVVLAQSPDNPNKYSVRYVRTNATPLLARRSQNDTLYLGPMYAAAFGPDAVERTTKQQASYHRGDDPYNKYKRTCDEGALSPILPQISFLFENETIQVELDLHMLLVPAPSNAALQRAMPFVAHEVNTMKDKLGASLKGPYCFLDNPRAGWILNVTMDSSSVSQTALSWTHGCVEGFPCVPPAMDIAHSNGTTPHVAPVCPQVNIPIANVWFWKICSTLLFILWGTTMLFFWRKSCKQNSQTLDQGEVDRESERDVGSSATERELEEPLLPSTASTDEDAAYDDGLQPLRSPDIETSSDE